MSSTLICIVWPYRLLARTAAFQAAKDGSKPSRVIMANHKRKRPKNRRSGCLMCKPHKANNAKNKEKISVKKKLQEVIE